MAQQEQQVIYLVMDENNQGQQIQFIDGQPTIVMDQQPDLASADADSQVLLVSEDGQLVTGNEGQVMVDESGQVVMTTDEGQQVALETEHLNVSQPPVSQIQYVLTSDAMAAKSSILTQAASVVAEEKVPNGSPTKEDDGYTTIMIGGEQAMPAISTDYANSQPTTSITHPILSTQLGATAITKSPQKAGAESPRAMISILDKVRLASLTQQRPKPPSKVVATVLETPQVVETEEAPMDITEDSMKLEESPAKLNGQVMEVDNVSITVQEAPEDGPQEAADTQEEGEVHVEALTHEEALPNEEALPHKETLPHEDALTQEEALPNEEALPHKEALPHQEELSLPHEEEVTQEEEVEVTEKEVPVKEHTTMAPPQKPLDDEATMLAKSLDEYMIKRPDVIVPDKSVSEPEDVQNIGTGTLLGPLPYDSDDSGPEIPFSDPPHAVATYEGKSKKKEEKKKVMLRTELEEDGNRRKSVRNKSPRRYSEEPIIFGDDWVKPSTESQKREDKSQKKEEHKEEEVKESPKRGRGRPAKVRTISEKSNGPAVRLTVAESKMPPKKRISREVSLSEDAEPEMTSPRKRGRPPKKRFLEKHNSQEAVEEKSISKLAEKKLSGGDAKEDFLDNFGFDEDSEKDDAVTEEPKKMVDTLLVHKPTMDPVVLSVDKPVVTHLNLGTVNKAAKWDSPIRADNIKIITTKATDVKNPPKEQPPPSESKLKFTEMKSTPKTARPLGTTSGGDRKLGIDVKTMKFSVSKRVSSGSESKRPLPKKTSPAPVSKPAKPSRPSANEEKELMLKEASLFKREQKNRALDTELDERTAQLRAKEGKLDRLQRQLKEIETALEMRERKIRRQEQAGMRQKRLEEGEDVHDEMKEWEERLNSREEKLRTGEQAVEQKQKLLAATEKQLTGLSKELAEKYEYLQDSDTQTKSGQPRQGLFERLANLSAVTEKRKADDEDDEDDEPLKKRNRMDTPKAESKEEKEESTAEESPAPFKRGRGRPRKSETPVPTSKAESEKKAMKKTLPISSSGKKDIAAKAAKLAAEKLKKKQQHNKKTRMVVATKKQAARTSRKVLKAVKKDRRK